MENIIGIGGILATIIVGIITCMVTWIVAKRSQKIMKFSWSAEITKVLNINPEVDRGKIQLLHDGIEIKNPHMIQMKIKNVGNASIAFPVLMIKVDNSDKIIPLGFNDIPYGYENKWKLRVISNKECKIELEHINPKQEFSIILFADGNEPKITVSCPMKDIALKEVKNDKTSTIASLFISDDNKTYLILILGILTGLIAVGMMIFTDFISKKLLYLIYY